MVDWSDEVLLLAAQKHGESAAIIDVLSRDRGRYRGYVPGGAGRRLRGVLQPGNTLKATWRARLDDHLGRFQVEEAGSRIAPIISQPVKLKALNAANAMLLTTLPEREAHPRLFDALAAFLDALVGGESEAEPIGAKYVRFELLLLSELGFGLDLTHCAVTGSTNELCYVSPKTGRAVSREAAGRWRDKLLPLPEFLVEGEPEGAQDIFDALKLTGHFIERELLAPAGRRLPEARRRFATRFGPKAKTDRKPG